MKNLLTVGYWINMRPETLSPLGFKLLGMFLGGLAVFAFISYLLKTRKRGLYFKIWRNLQTLCLTNLFIGLMLLFFSYESLPFLAMRLWFLLWGLGILAWLGFILKVLMTIPKEKKKMSKEKEFKKYIP